MLFGQAVTIRYFPTRKDIQHPIDNNFASLFYRAIEGGGEGKVLVMGGGGHPDSAFGGGRKLSRLRHNGLAGVLAEGRLRDFDALGDYEFATFCRGETVRQGGNLIMPIAAERAGRRSTASGSSPATTSTPTPRAPWWSRPPRSARSWRRRSRARSATPRPRTG